MRTSDVIVSIGLLGLAFGLSPAVSFDGTRTPEAATVAVPLPGREPTWLRQAITSEAPRRSRRCRPRRSRRSPCRHGR